MFLTQRSEDDVRAKLLGVDFEHAGEFGGRFTLEWLSPRDYAYTPVPGDEFYFKRASGEIIKPTAMHTDGGTIPRLVWSLPNLSPWDYLPAYIIHDYEYVMHHEGDTKHSFEEVNLTLAEAVYTLMATKVVPMNRFSIWLIYQAVSSVVGRQIWEKTSPK